jgi:hypothetical protein
MVVSSMLSLVIGVAWLVLLAVGQLDDALHYGAEADR